MKKAFCLILSAIMCLCVFTACGDKDSGGETDESAYTGILTKVKLGMPLTKIITLNPDRVDLYYEDDTTIWCINPDTDLLPELRALIPSDDGYQYADDSIITYKFRTVKSDPEIYLTSFTEEVHCLIDREAAQEYFDNKAQILANKHCKGAEGSVTSVQKGTEDVDMNIEMIHRLSASSYTVEFVMTLTYMTVDGVDGYYATEFSIATTEKSTRGETSIKSPEVVKEEK